MVEYTPIQDIPTIHSDLRKTFRTGITKPYEWRRHQLLQLARFAQENSDALAECLRLDLGRSKQEAIMGDVSAVISRCLLAAEKLEEWMKPEPVVVNSPLQRGFKTSVERHPKGIVLIVSPWNFPIILSLQPLYGAISAGCCAAIKPSEMSPNCSAFLAENLHKYLDPSAYRVILGGVPEMTKVLELKWDHICYTGNGRVGRIISAAAAKHLTPLTLELGGKSPVIIDSTADISLAAKRILWGKIFNTGQICVAPDYILAEKSIIPALVEALKEHYHAFYPNGALASDSYGHIISDSHLERLKGLVEKTKGTIVFGGTWEGKARRSFEPTLVVDVKEDDILLEEEIFGPILPIVAVEDLDEAIAFVNNRDHPLVSYIFSNNEDFKQKFIANTTSGNVWIGDTFQQVGVSEVPFGGVGESGYGRQSMKACFDDFSYQRGLVEIPDGIEPFLTARYPPYTEGSLEIITQMINQPIPPSDPATPGRL
ncbi:hypothetical protein CVT25_003299 [Psilocybe cyanescens]|uniref:Aldehyde dehydrogenase n=1 Tax=Psilocybe cyanescens TaxID=93625 RepID=A0A409WMM5_PSICY|nr:hypothetical protein CVT25_003299 [Psilocybe cyanescens]